MASFFEQMYRYRQQPLMALTRRTSLNLCRVYSAVSVVYSGASGDHTTALRRWDIRQVKQLSRLRCHGHSRLLSSYMSNTFRRIFLHNCPASEPSARHLLLHLIIFIQPLVQDLGCGPFVGLSWSFSTAPFSGRGPKALIPTIARPLYYRSEPVFVNTRFKSFAIIRKGIVLNKFTCCCNAVQKSYWLHW